jgi:hypothetical protein
MECHLGCWLNGTLRDWVGRVQGRIDLSHPPRDERMPLSDLFVPDPSEAKSVSDAGKSAALLLHRALALASLEADVFKLHLEANPPRLTAQMRALRGQATIVLSALSLRTTV